LLDVFLLFLYAFVHVKMCTTAFYTSSESSSDCNAVHGIHEQR
jgi:hypothetical protein